MPYALGEMFYLFEHQKLVQVVLQVFGRHPVEPLDELPKPLIKCIDVLYMFENSRLKDDLVRARVVR